MRLRKDNEGLDVKLKSNKKSIFDTLSHENTKEVKQPKKDGNNAEDSKKKRTKNGKKTPNFTVSEDDNSKVKRKKSKEKANKTPTNLEEGNSDLKKKKGKKITSTTDNNNLEANKETFQVSDEDEKRKAKTKVEQNVRKIKSKADRNSLIKGSSKVKKELKSKNVKKTKSVKLDQKNVTKVKEYKLNSLEKEMLQKGTIKDKINILTLLVETNPSVENYKNLLFYSENQRNDVIFYTLNNVKDILIAKGPMKDYAIKQRITKTLEINLKNNFIKIKVLRLVYSLLKNNIYFLELIYPFVNKIGDKKEVENYVSDKCKSLFYVNEEILLDCFEEFYFKNSNFKSRNSILKILSEIASSDPSQTISGDLYNKFLDSFNLDLPDEQRNILLGHILEGLSRSLDVNPNMTINNIDLVKSCIYSDKISLYSFKLLYLTKSPHAKDLLYKIISNNIIRDSKQIQKFINYMYEFIMEEKDQSIIKYIINTSLLHKKDFIISVLTILYKYRKTNKLDVSNCYGLRLLTVHYSSIIRKMSTSIIKNKKIDEVNPFDNIEVEINENTN